MIAFLRIRDHNKDPSGKTPPWPELFRQAEEFGVRVQSTGLLNRSVSEGETHSDFAKFRSLYRQSLFRYDILAKRSVNASARHLTPENYPEP